MALILGLNTGQGVYLGDTLMTVEKIKSPTRFVVLVHGRHLESSYEITDRRAEEVLPTVMVSAGLEGSHHLARLVIEAPKSVRIWREELYKEKKGL